RRRLHTRFFDILQEKPARVHISEIGQKSARKAGRVLRILASMHIFREGVNPNELVDLSKKLNLYQLKNEVSENVFANNRLSMQLLSGNALSSLGLHLSVLLLL
ncbi:hypothetical protein BYT27DRAFT_7086444, partial [Phlegmacium glaucopus]